LTRSVPAPIAIKAAVGATVAVVAVFCGVQGGPASAGAHAEAAGAKLVNISGYAFEPRVLRVRKGARVRFTNTSYMTHTATDEGAFDTGDIRPGASAVVRLGRKGVYPYHCLIHPFMRGKIIVR
jgi:plastocyanin